MATETPMLSNEIITTANGEPKKRRRPRIALIVAYCLLGLLFVLNICASVYFFTADKTDLVFEDNILKVVEIKTQIDEFNVGYATGAFIDKNGTILTNKHVVRNTTTQTNYQQFWVRTADMADWVEAEIVSVSADYDLATLKCELHKEAFTLANEVKNGETIYTIGNPNGFGLSFATGVVASNSRNIIHNGETIHTFQASLVINEGNSGGPVFNKDGKLLGIVSFRLHDNAGEIVQGVAFIVPIKDIKDFLAK